jgi:hypothetical protein
MLLLMVVHTKVRLFENKTVRSALFCGVRVCAPFVYVLLLVGRIQGT